MDVIDLSSESDDSEVFKKARLQKADDNEDLFVKRLSDVRPAHYMSDDDSDSEFPEVPFAKKTYSNSEPIYSKTSSIQKSSDNINIEEELSNKYLVRQPISEPINVGGKNKKNGLNNYDKELLRIQKLKNAEEAARKKAEKAAMVERSKSMKPGECMKYMKVILDSNFQNFDFFDDLITEVQTLELQYQLKSQIIPNSVTWARKIQENGRTTEQIENQIIIVWDYVETVKKISDGTFVTAIVSAQVMIPGKVVTLIIYGIQNYFKYHKNLTKRHVKNQSQGNMRDVTKGGGSKAFKDLPKIAKKQLELQLTEIQLRINCNTQFIDTPQRLGETISQYTKAIAEAPFKIQKKQSAQGKLDWYSAADNKDTVKVDKNGNGLKRLWQQQLCQFNLAKLETAEAVISQYPTPLHLMEAYENCTPSEGAKLLQDIAIRRTAGPLTAVRKIGPELSKKIYLMFTTEDGEILVGNE